jgi:hypothetical protein
MRHWRHQLQISHELPMRPFNLILILTSPLWLGLLIAWTEKKRRAVKILIWGGAVFLALVGFAFAPDEGIGPATWGEAADWVMPDGYVPHSVETAIFPKVPASLERDLDMPPIR